MAEAMSKDFHDLDLCEGAVGGLHPNQAYSSDDISCHYSSLTQVQFTSPLEPSHGVVSLPDHRRKSVASVQTERRPSSSKNHVQRRRSELSDRERRRKSRAEAEALALDPAFLKEGGGNGSMNGVRRGTRNSQMLSSYDLESARLSLSSNRHRKMSRVSGTPEEEPIDPEERHRSRVVVVCASIAIGIFLTAILLVAITLKMSPSIDEMVRKENEDILQKLKEVSSGSHGLNATTTTTVPPAPTDPATTDNPQT